MAPAQFAPVVFRPIEPVRGLEQSRIETLPGSYPEDEAWRQMRAALRADATLIGGTIKAVH